MNADIGEQIEGLDIWQRLSARIGGLFDGSVTEPAREWLPGLEGVIRQKDRGVLYGSTGEGKSWALAVMAWQCARAGGRALIVDYENGQRRTEHRVDKLITHEGSDEIPTEAMDRIDYGLAVDLGEMRANDFAWEQWLLRLQDFDLLILDGLPRLLCGVLGYDESSPGDVIAFYNRYVDPVVNSLDHRTAVVVGDNTGWDTRRMRGASAKADLCELAYRVTGGRSCSVVEHGTINLKLTRWRDGTDQHRHLVLGIGGGEYTDLRATEDATSEADMWHAAAVAIITEAERALSRNALAREAKDSGLKFTRSKFLEAIAGWITDPDDELIDCDGRVGIAGEVE